jgi:putative PIG3 family NAD(P)H quinone oxidoreductase
LKFINFKNEKLFLDECEIENPKENQIQIEVHSTGVNRADILQKKGHYPPPKGESEIIGLECAGIVCKIGPNSSKFKVGDKVCAILGGGGYAEFVNVDEKQVMPIPSNVSLLEAGALPETILTVYENIFNISEFKNNEVVLIHGGSSGIGTTAISILKNFTDQLYVTVGSKDKCDSCLQLGAKAAINYKEEDFEQYFVDQKIKVDIILDMVGGSYFKKNLKILNQKGRLTYIAALESIKAEVNLLYIMTKQLKVSGSTLRSRSPKEKGKIVNQVVEHIWPLIQQGKYKSTIFQSFNMEDVNLAHELMESSSHIGKILLDIKGGQK